MAKRRRVPSVYRSLRERVEALGKLSGPASTGQIVKALDPLWRTMVELRRVAFQAAREAGVVEDPSLIKPGDFLAVYLMVSSEGSSICPECLSAVEPGECPHCGATVPSKAPSKALKEIVVDFDQPEGRPDWDIDLSKPDSGEKIPLLRPITKVDLIPGPRGKSDRKSKKKPYSLSKAARAQRVWIRKREFGRHVPYSINQLRKMKVKDLRTIATLMPEYDLVTCRSMSLADLIRFILAHQGQAPIDPGPPPHGGLPIIPTEGDDE